MIDEKFVATQKKVLEKLQEKLQTQIKKSQKYPELGTSPEDNAQEVEAFASNLALEDRLVKELKEVKKSFSRIEKKKYGICTKCSGPIERGRLKAYPAAELCLTCATKKRR